jgi:hypothetical protein
MDKRSKRQAQPLPAIWTRIPPLHEFRGILLERRELRVEVLASKRIWV